MNVVVTESDYRPLLRSDYDTDLNYATDDLSREVFGFLGLTVDALSYQQLMRSIETAAETAKTCLLSTPNVNFLVTSRRNADFRESLLVSDLCLADGMPLIWIARILGIPIRERVTGADLFDTLKGATGRKRRLRVFLFGGAEGVAEAVSRHLNVSSVGMECVGALNPGFGSVEDMSTERVIDTINSSGADLLAVFLGAEKAQTWLLRNHHLIKIPIRAQFGAAINFEAGTIKRAPAILRNSGFEWLWRIKEEPHLWRRYWHDGRGLLRLVFGSVLPLAINSYWARLTGARPGRGLQIANGQQGSSGVIKLSGTAFSQYADQAIPRFRAELMLGRNIVIDCSELVAVDPRFVGLLLMVRKQLMSKGQTLSFINVPNRIRRAFRFNGFEFLLPSES